MVGSAASSSEARGSVCGQPSTRSRSRRFEAPRRRGRIEAQGDRDANCYAGLAQAAEDGYPIRERVEHFLDGPMVLAPKVDGAVLLSHRGGDFQISVGQDLSIGYAGHDKDKVHLYLTESFAFRVLERGAAVYLKPRRGKK